MKITIGTSQSTLRQFTVILALGVLFSLGCARHSGLPEAGSKEYRDFCSAFYVGLAGLESGEDVRAKRELTRATQTVPAEPVAWADLGVLEVRQQQFDAAFTSVDKARALAPDSSRIEEILGLIESRRGKVGESLAHLRKAVSLDGKNLKALYALADETSRQGLPGGDAKAVQTLERLLSVEPSNTAVLLEVVRLSAKSGDIGRLRQTLEKLAPLTGNWPDPAKQQLAAIQQTAASGSPQTAAVQVQFLKNVLVRVPAYRQSLDEVRTPANLGAQPISRFLRLPVPSSEPAPADTKLAFTAQDLPGVSASGVLWINAIALDDQGAPAVVWADASGVHVTAGPALPLPRGTSALSVHAIAGADLNYDFKTDLIVASAGGLKIYRQIDPQHFSDVTTETKLPPAILNGSYTGAWAFDFDLDGDLDIVLGTPQGEPWVLRNNGDGTFTPVHPFKGVDGMVAFTAADIDGDGDPDVALIDKNGRLITFTNERLGDFQPLAVPNALTEKNLALAAADVNSDGRLDFIVLRSDFSVVRLSNKAEGQGWDTAELLKAKPGQANLLVGDLDNNGALDIVVGDQVFLGDGKSYVPLALNLNADSQALADLHGDGRLDIVGLRDGHATDSSNHGAQNYHWQVVRTRAAHATGDQRINSFGIGGEIELRSDLFTQKEMIASPILHFGLGTHTGVDFARIVWPNGSMQAEFELKPDQEVMAEQRIKGSCPMLFTWNGQRMQFLKDVGPWGSALGLNVNAQGKGVYPTGEWFKMAGDELKPHDGYYDIRITAEYWETYYMDHYSLLVVDHPASTEVFADERFALPPPPSKVIATQNTKPFAHAWDDQGKEVTEVVREQDANFLGHFDKGQYQGIARDHWVELELPADAPATGPLYLIGAGWIHDTDASIVKALSQNTHVVPQQMSIEVPDAAGHWATARQGLGFLKGRLKTVMLDISGIFRPGAPRKLRLRTNLEIYWDKLSWAPGLALASETDIRVQPLSLAAADLRYRGFSRITQANETSPEVPNYDVVEESALKWHDQEGFVTRYGDVRELLEKIDDRFVITSPGDELRMRFNAPPPPAAGWKRDFILICDGWVKDGDYNSTFSRTVAPLPYHGMTEYTTAPASLELEKAYRLHPADWQIFQTRYVTATYFEKALWGH